MANRDEFLETGNGYINIPVWLFESMYRGDHPGFKKFLSDVITWGLATEQIGSINHDKWEYSEIDGGAPKDFLSDWVYFVNELCNQNQYNFRSRFACFKNWLTENGKEDWERSCHVALAGITFNALNKMIFGRYGNRKEQVYTEHCWLVYFALKSILGKKINTDGKCSWDNILNRALGSTPLKVENCHEGEIDWTLQYRSRQSYQSRKKMTLLKMLQDNWGFVYTPKDPRTGKQRKVPWFGFSRCGFRKG